MSFADGVEDTLDRIGHGTAVAAVVREKAPAAPLLPVKLFDRHLSTNADTLARAIMWAADNAARIINLSLGTTNSAHAQRLGDAVQYAAERGALVVAAREAGNVVWFPGSLAMTLGVVADAACDRDEIRIERTASGALYAFASIYPRPIPDVPPERNLSGISFAVANVSGFLARAFEDADDATTADAVLRALG
jgi:subtilisin family serine protease